MNGIMNQDSKIQLQLFCQKKESFVFSMLVEEVQKKKQMRIELVPFNEKYVLSFKISQQALTVHPVLSNYYETLEQLYEDIEQTFQEIAISKQGLISYQLLVGGKRRRRIELQTQKSLARSILSKRRQWQKKEQIPVHVVSAVGFDSERETILKRLVDFDEKFSKLEETVKKQNETIAKLNDQVEQLKEKVEDGNFQVNSLRVKVEENQNKLQKCEYYLQVLSFQQSGLLEQVYNNQLDCSISQLKPQTSHLLNNDAFKVILNPDGPRIKKISNDTNWQNFILDGPISRNKVTSIKIQVYKSANGQINLGVCSQAIFNQFNTLKASGYIAYDFRKGAIWSMGKKVHESGVVVQKGECVTLTVDLLHQRLFWFKESGDSEQFLGDVVLPAYFRYVDLYMVITILKPGQGVRLINE